MRQIEGDRERAGRGVGAGGWVEGSDGWMWLGKGVEMGWLGLRMGFGSHKDMHFIYIFL